MCCCGYYLAIAAAQAEADVLGMSEASGNHTDGAHCAVNNPPDARLRASPLTRAGLGWIRSWVVNPVHG